MAMETNGYDPGMMGALPLGSSIQHILGNSPAATYIANPGAAKFIVMIAERGGWRIRRGDYHTSGMPSVEYPAVAVSDGSGALYLPEGRDLTLPLTTGGITVAGYATTSILTYFFV